MATARQTIGERTPIGKKKKKVQSASITGFFFM
jgi:hypothetical protein